MRVLWFFLVGCQPGVSADAGPPDTAEPSADSGAADSGGQDCGPRGTFACPITVASFPYSDARDTAQALQDSADTYSCAPSTEEGGPEWVYAVDLASAGTLTPAVGPVVKEAHLVTNEEWSGSWPMSFTDGIPAHYALSEGVTGYGMTRSEPWAPAGEGGSEYGQGATGSPIPAADEAWYLNMYWRDRPARGTRMLVMNPWTGHAVVAAGGYETGPGSNTSIGGVVEEVHDHLQTGHRDDLIIGFLVNQSLALGPIDCGPR